MAGERSDPRFFTKGGIVSSVIARQLEKSPPDKTFTPSSKLTLAKIVQNYRDDASLWTDPKTALETRYQKTLKAVFDAVDKHLRPGQKPIDAVDDQEQGTKLDKKYQIK